VSLRDVVCAVDVGTSAVRAALVTSTGKRLRSVRRPRPAGECGTVFTAGLLWDDLRIALRALTDDLGELRVHALAIAGHVGTVLIDESYSPLDISGGWADRRGIDLVAGLWADPGAALRRAGRPAATGGAVPLLCWLRVAHPDLHRRVRWVLSPKDFLTLRLTGMVATDHTSAAYTLASDVVRRSWSYDLLAPAGLSLDCLPRQHAAADLVGEVTATAAQQTGLPAGLPVAAGGPDGTVGAAAMIGERTDVVADVAGTTDVIMKAVKSPADTVPRAVLNPYLADGLWSCGGPTGMTGGAVAHWCRLLGLTDPATASQRLSSQLEALPPGCDGLSMSPLLNGSRFPDWRPDESGVLWGLTEHHSAAHLVRAAQEAACFVVREGAEVLTTGQQPHQVTLGGGAARSTALAQLRADVLGCPVLVSSEPDVSLHGAALLALIASGLQPGLAAAQATSAPDLREYVPNKERASLYADLFESWREARRSRVD
jgi:xylulokinase